MAGGNPSVTTRSYKLFNMVQEMGNRKYFIFIYGYTALDIWTVHIARVETHCRHMGYSFR